MKSLEVCLQAGSLLSLLVLASAAQAQSGPLTSIEQIEHTAVVRGLQVHDRTISGVIENNSSRLLRDVRVIIRHTWRWRNERHPGDDNPGRSEDFTIPGEVPPNGTLPFTLQLHQPLPQRNDGSFVNSADVIGFTEVGN